MSLRGHDRGPYHENTRSLLLSSPEQSQGTRGRSHSQQRGQAPATHPAETYTPWSVNCEQRAHEACLWGFSERDSYQQAPAAPAPRLTFSSAETSAILGSGDGARFFTSNKTSRKHVRQLVTAQAHRAAGRPEGRKWGLPRGLLHQGLHKPPAPGWHGLWLGKNRLWVTVRRHTAQP